MRFVLPSLVDAHLPAPASPPRAPGLAHTPPAQPDTANPSLAQPDPKSPSLTTNPRSIRRFTYCAAISGLSALNPGRNPTKRSTQPHTPTSNRAHPPVSISLRPPFKVVCCDIWILGRVWGPICEISQHSTCQTTEIPNHRSVTWFTHKFNAPQPPGMCAAILPVFAPDSPPGGRYRSTLPWTAGFAARMGEYCAAISGFWAPSPGAHPTKRSTQLPEGRSDLGAGRFEPGGRR